MGSRTVQLALVAAVSLLVAGASRADDDDLPAEARRGEFYIKLSSGYGLSDDSDLRIVKSDDTDLTFVDVTWDDNSLSGPSARYSDVRFGYFTKRRPWAGFAVDFLHFKIFAELDRSFRVVGTDQGMPIDTVQPMSAIVERYQVGNGVNFLTASFIARGRFKRDEQYPDGRVQPYGGAGAGPTVLYVQSRVNGDSRSGPYELGNLGVQAIGGAQWLVTPRWDLFFEYKYTYTSIDGSVRLGNSETDLHSHHFTIGGGFHF